jgi:hypothetical protein
LSYFSCSLLRASSIIIFFLAANSLSKSFSS